MRVDAVLETCLYASDLDAAERFYADVIGLELYSREPGRHAFFRCGAAMFLVFDPGRTSNPGVPTPGSVVVPPHGAFGPGHVAFRVDETTLPAWRASLASAGIMIEAEVEWPRGGRSIYIRDPAGNSVELASPAIWRL
jgi:catechol 2,3-dioxygenase-like lactoylglutathione lyase family enzyme